MPEVTDAVSPQDGDDDGAILAGSSRALLDPSGIWATLERRIFATNQFFRLWIAQVVTATGDWLFFFAATFTAARVGGEQYAAASVGSVVAARIVPGLFLSQIAGVLADRWDRRKLMVTTDLARAGVVLAFPFINHVWQLVALALILEVFTLLWIPAKEASVPNLVPRSHLTTANSLAVFATYGSVLLAAGLFFAMAPGADRLAANDSLAFLQIDKESLSFYVDSITFLVSAALIASLVLPHRAGSNVSVADNKLHLGGAWQEFKEGWSLIASEPTVRAVIIGLATAMIGGGMVIPLGSIYAPLVGAGLSGWTAMCVALGVGAGIGVLVLSLFQGRLQKRATFLMGVFGAGVFLFLAASFASLGWVIVALGLVGVCAAPVYVTGFTLLHETVTDEMRGRVFSTLYSLIRACVAFALVVGPFLSAALDEVSDAAFGGTIMLGSYSYVLPGVRLTLWLAAMVIIAAGVLAARSMGADPRARLKIVTDQ